MAPAIRTTEQRISDTVQRLRHDIDAWVATADTTGAPYLIPLSFLWDGHDLWLSTAASSQTSRNLLANGRVRLTLGLTRDVVLIEGAVDVLASDQLSGELGDAFATKTGFDPRGLTSRYLYFRVTPLRLQAWREENELAERDLFREGQWLVAPPES
ncbi:MAG: pyridoxamine 5'-phosphate oxidase family protein [Propionibacteriaceae bacterium]